MQSLSSSELKYFAKIQGLSVFIATLLLVVSHNASRFTFNSSTQFIYAAFALVFSALFIINLFFGNQVSKRFTQASVVIYSLLSVGMLVLFLYV